MQRAYYAIIPANVRYNRNLPPNAKLLYGEITALCNERGYCWAGDKYFADLYGVSKTAVQSWIKALHENGLISKEITYKEGSKEILHRYIKIIEYPMQENLGTPIQENLRENNTCFNNTTNTNMSSSKKVPVKKIIDHLNEVAESRFSAKSADTQKHIKARWNEGNDLETFIAVIDHKTKEWKDDPTMSKYLRPSTLFAAKNFENYKAAAFAEQRKRNKQQSQSSDIDLKRMSELFGDLA